MRVSMLQVFISGGEDVADASYYHHSRRNCFEPVISSNYIYLTVSRKRV
jgi:hypothetical protein